MASKIDKMAKLTEGLLSLPEQGQPPPVAAKAKRPVGTPVNLRMPPDLLAAYAAEAGRRSAEKGRTVTTQAVMLEVLTAGRPERG